MTSTPVAHGRKAPGHRDLLLSPVESIKILSGNESIDKCRPCSDRQATCEHYVVSDDKDYQPPTKKAKEPMKLPKQIPNLYPLRLHIQHCE
jgi:hypothetical protein